MSWSNALLTKNFVAGGAIAAYRAVIFGAADNTVLQATAAAANQIGVCAQPGGAAAGERVDVTLVGIEQVECGGAVVRGVPVTADADGKIVAAAAAALAIGIPMESGAAGDIVPLLIGRERLAA